jgi:hypothetical protein
VLEFEEKGLGFHPGPVDNRDRPLSATIERVVTQKESGSRFWFNPLRLDQMAEGACVGFGWTQCVNSSPKSHEFPNEVAREVYYAARRDYDEWPGEGYEGTSVRAGAKAATARGWIQSYAFAASIDEVALWVLNRGPVVIGIDWHESDYRPSRRNGYFLTGEGEVVGGHCLLVDGVRWGLSEPYFRLLNSWGASWGYNGRAKISVENLRRLLSQPYAVACTATEL